MSNWKINLDEQTASKDGWSFKFQDLNGYSDGELIEKPSNLKSGGVIASIAKEAGEAFYTTLDDRRKKYELKRVAKRVSFNANDELDRKRIEFANSINFSLWAKQKIDEELSKSDKF